MKKRLNYVISIILLVALIINCFAISASAINGDVNFEPSGNSGKAGDKITIIAKAETTDKGIACVDFKYSFDNSKLELTSKGIINDDDWQAFKEDNHITIMDNVQATDGMSEEEAFRKRADLYKFEFTIKDTAKDNETLTVTFSEITLNTYVGANNDTEEKTISDIMVDITVRNSGGEPTNTTPTNTTPSNTTPTNTTPTNTTPTNTTPTNTTPTNTTPTNTTPSNNTTPRNNINRNETDPLGNENIEYVNDISSKDKDDTPSGPIPQTGVISTIIIIVSISILGTIGLAALKKMRIK